jgi:uncharacterized membrane protein YdbT with pleckstrin-like domain
VPSYVATSVSPDEALRFVGHVHWWIYVPPSMLTVFGLTLMIFASGSDSAAVFLLVGAIFALAGLVNLVRDFIYAHTTELAVTDRRVIGKWGLIRRDTIEQRLDKVDATLVHQSILGRMFDFGTITVRGSGTTNTPIRMVTNPLAFRKAVDLAASEFETRTKRTGTL